MSNRASGFCPYKGLQPYTSEDRAYFFGRERDQEIISANLYAAPLTILYGASGVGKSSVLLAGVVPQLKQVPRIATVVFRDWQDAGFLSALKACVLVAVAATVIAFVQRERAKQAQKKTADALKVAEDEKQRADKLADILKDLSSKNPAQIDHAVKDLKQLQDARAFPVELVPAIEAIIKEKEKEATPATKETSIKVNEVIDQIVVDNPNAVNYVDEERLPTRFVIEIQNDTQKDEAEKIRKSLAGKGFITPNIHTKSDADISQNELRYFRDKDIERAKQAVAVLEGLKIPAKLRLVRGYESTVSRRTVELGLAPPKVKTDKVSESKQ